MYQLQFKPLIRLWDHTVYPTLKKKKPSYTQYDGCYVVNALFSIEAFATNPKSPNQAYCKDALALFLNRLRKDKQHIEKTHREHKSQWGDIVLVPFHANAHKLDLTLESKQLCRSTGLFIKLFSCANAYLFDLHRAQRNEEISDEAFQTAQRDLLTTLSALIQDISANAQTFHIERKKLEIKNEQTTAS